MIWCLNCNFSFSSSISFWYFSISYCRFPICLFWLLPLRTVGLIEKFRSMSSTLPSVMFPAVSWSISFSKRSICWMSLFCSLVNFAMSMSSRLMSTSFIRMDRLFAPLPSCYIDMFFSDCFMSLITCCFYLSSNLL